MKKIYRQYLILFSLSSVMIACNDNEETPTISNDEAVEQVSSVVSSDIVGLTADVNKLVQRSTSDVGRVSTCGIAYDTAITYSFSGSLVSLNYEADYDYRLNCSGIIPTDLFTNFSSSSSYEGPRVITQGNSNGTFTTTGLIAGEYTVDGTFVRVGSLDQKQGAQNSFSSTYTAMLSELTIDKASGDFTGGTLEMSVDGVSNNRNYNFSATVVFNGDGSITATINGDAAYLIDIDSGSFTAM
ncbi:MAG: hypothetical protein AAGA66_12245 [Bacteroidota bacterium]